jgi:hypothetical protein
MKLFFQKGRTQAWDLRSPTPVLIPPIPYPRQVAPGFGIHIYKMRVVFFFNQSFGRLGGSNKMLY